MIEVSLKPETLFTIAGMPITNSLWVSFAITILLSLVLGVVSRRLKPVPGTLQLFVETLLGGFYQFILNLTRNLKLTKQIFPVFMTVALFFLTANLLSNLPGLLAFTVHGHHLYRPATADYALVFGITIVMFVYWQVTIARQIGFFGYTKRFLNFSNPIQFFVGLLEIVGETAKIISLSFRLFGNIFSEEILMLVMLSLAPFVAPVPFSLLGILISVIQAFLFPLLILLFMNVGIAEHTESHAKEHSEQASAVSH